jgi:hypothetical protein
VLADDLGLDRSRADLESFGDMNAKPKAVDQCASAEDTVVPGETAYKVGERIGRIGHDKQHCGRCRRNYLGDDLVEHADVGVEQLEAPLAVIAIGSAAALLIDSGSKHHEVSTGEIRVVPIA